MKKALIIFLIIILTITNSYTFISSLGKITFSLNGEEYGMPASNFFITAVLIGYLANLIYNTIFKSEDAYQA